VFGRVCQQTNICSVYLIFWKFPTLGLGPLLPARRASSFSSLLIIGQTVVTYTRLDALTIIRRYTMSCPTEVSGCDFETLH
jgi:hypothetical protein